MPTGGPGQALKVQALQLVVIPTLSSAFSKGGQGEELLDEKTINTIVKDLLDPGDEVRALCALVVGGEGPSH